LLDASEELIVSSLLLPLKQQTQQLMRPVHRPTFRQPNYDHPLLLRELSKQKMTTTSPPFPTSTPLPPLSLLPFLLLRSLLPLSPLLALKVSCAPVLLALSVVGRPKNRVGRRRKSG
jgi:hypothetical protein